MSSEQPPEAHRDHVDDCCRPFSEIRQREVAYTEQVVQADCRENVEYDVGKTNSPIAPTLAGVDVGLSEELVCGGEGAVLAA